jgi:hypothetical protein
MQGMEEVENFSRILWNSTISMMDIRAVDRL